MLLIGNPSQGVYDKGLWTKRLWLKVGLCCLLVSAILAADTPSLGAEPGTDDADAAGLPHPRGENGWPGCR